MEVVVVPIAIAMRRTVCTMRLRIPILEGSILPPPFMGMIAPKPSEVSHQHIAVSLQQPADRLATAAAVLPPRLVLDRRAHEWCHPERSLCHPERLAKDLLPPCARPRRDASLAAQRDRTPHPHCGRILADSHQIDDLEGLVYRSDGEHWHHQPVDPKGSP